MRMCCFGRVDLELMADRSSRPLFHLEKRANVLHNADRGVAVSAGFCALIVSSLSLKFLSLFGVPPFEPPNRLSLHRKLDMDVRAMGTMSHRMPHQGLADLLDDSRLDQPHIEHVAQIVETAVPDARTGYRMLPCGFYLLDGPAFVGEDKSRALLV